MDVLTYNHRHDARPKESKEPPWGCKGVTYSGKTPTETTNTMTITEASKLYAAPPEDEINYLDRYIQRHDARPEKSWQSVETPSETTSTMTITAASKLPVAPPEDEILLAQALPLLTKDPRPSGDDPNPKAYAVYNQQYISVEAGASMASVVNKAAVVKNLGWCPETRRLFIWKLYSILVVQLLATGLVSAGMILHALT